MNEKGHINRKKAKYKINTKRRCKHPVKVAQEFQKTIYTYIE